MFGCYDYLTNIKRTSYNKVYIRNPTNICGISSLVGLPGFEPGQTEPKPVVLPLHHSPIIGAFLEKRCKGRGFIHFYQIFCRVFFDFVRFYLSLSI